MFKRHAEGRSFLWLSLVLSIPTVWLVSSAQAHYRHHYYYHWHHWRFASRAHRWHAPREAPSNFAAIVVDGNSGRVLYARDENALRHPASITKVMTLYLLFEQLEDGRLHLNSRLRISAHAAEQEPTKLGLKPGETISVEDAIKAIVTLSANDIAVAVAEAIGGDEDNFAAMMTREAHALGMSRTRYVNASGLPDEGQITSAADLALLGRAIQQRFPRYYHYFSTRVFDYDGVANRNHNHLLGRIAGLDGIKTGYTRESGYNLLASVKRDGHFIVAVVLGGATYASRDWRMADLIETEIDKSSTRRSAPIIAEVAAERRKEGQPLHAGKISGPPSTLGSAATDPLPVASIAPMPRPRPAFVTGAPVSLDEDQVGTGIESGHAAFDGSTERPTTSITTPSMLGWAPVARGGREAEQPKPQSPEIAAESAPGPASDSLRPPAAHSGWMIQIGATDDAARATELLARAKARKLDTLDDAQAFTEKIRKGDETFYRARFAGLDADDAQAACRSLRRSGFACFATKN